MENKFRKDNVKIFYGFSEDKYNFNFNQFAKCPHCGIFHRPVLANSNSVQRYPSSLGMYYLVHACRCEGCAKYYIVVYDLNPDNKRCEFILSIPSLIKTFQDDIIEKISPRFISLYNQVITAEHNGCYELAAMGSRVAMEVLLCDFAIKELNVTAEELDKLKLFEIVDKYYKEVELNNSSTVIRKLGNDFAHYRRDFDRFGLVEINLYMEILIRQIKSKHLALHPVTEENFVL